MKRCYFSKKRQPALTRLESYQRVANGNYFFNDVKWQKYCGKKPIPWLGGLTIIYLIFLVNWLLRLKQNNIDK